MKPRSGARIVEQPSATSCTDAIAVGHEGAFAEKRER
jgi:hypothetical protein